MPTALLAASSLTFEALDAEPQILTVASDAAWVLDAPEWILTDHTAGTNTVDVTVRVEDNVDADGKLAAPRDGVITIKAADSDYTITTKVYQKGDTYLGAPETDLAGLAALDDESRAKASESQVVALASNGFIATDASATMYILGNQDKVKVGDKVTMNGTVSTQFGVKVFNSDEVVAVEGQYTEPAAKDVTAEIAAYKPAKIEYIKVTGTLIGSSLRVGETMGAATLFSPAIDVEAMAVHNVVAYGYALLNDGSTLHFVPTRFEDKGLNEDLAFYPITWNFVAGENLTFVSDNRLEPASGLGFVSYVTVNLEASNKNNKFARTIGGTGEPYITGAWPGDYWLFTGYGAIKAGTEVNIKFETRTSATGHKFWSLEYLDGTVWKTAGEVKTTSEPGDEITYTHQQQADGKTNIIVDETFRFNKNNDQLQVRFRCMANWQSGGSGSLEARNGGTVRLSVSEANGYIYPAIEVLKEGDGVEKPDADPINANVSVSSDLVTFEGTPEGPQTVTVVSDYDFRVAENISWLEIDVTEGAANEEKVITLTCQPNELSLLRKGQIEITSEATKKIIHVVQSSAGQELEPFVSLVGGNSGNVGFDEGTFNLGVQSNIEFEYSSDASWVTLEAVPETRALVEFREVAVKYEANSVAEPRTARIRVYNTEYNVETVYTLTQAAYESGVYFQDDFTWIAPWADAGKAADSITDNNPSGTAPNVYTDKAHIDGGLEGYPSFLTEFANRGYVDLNPGKKIMYTQKYYLKFGKTDAHTGIKLPANEFEGAAPADVELTFNWAAQMTKNGAIDQVKIVVELEGDGVCADSGEKVSKPISTTQVKGKLAWQDAKVLLSGVTNSTRIIIRPTLLDNSDGVTQKRWYIDNIKLAKAEPIFTETFDWVAPWVDNYGGADSVGEDDPSGKAANVYSQKTHLEGGTPGYPAFLTEFAKRGYEDINAGLEVLYTQKYYLKFGKTGNNTGLKLPAIDFGSTPRTVLVKFNWACHRRVLKAGKPEEKKETDPVNIVVEVLDAAGQSVFVSEEFVTTQPVDKMEWQSASVTLTNITSANRIVIRPSNMTPGETDVNRWYLDNINIF